jgi:stress-induced-phosphoprotein 1
MPSPPASPPQASPPKEPPVADSKLAADEEKQKGNTAYKAHDFDAAINHYTRAWDIHHDITYLNNLSAAHFEKGEYEKSIEAAERAVEEGREQHADFKLIAKYPTQARAEADAL